MEISGNLPAAPPFPPLKRPIVAVSLRRGPLPARDKAVGLHPAHLNASTSVVSTRHRPRSALLPLAIRPTSSPGPSLQPLPETDTDLQPTPAFTTVPLPHRCASTPGGPWAWSKGGPQVKGHEVTRQRGSAESEERLKTAPHVPNTGCPSLRSVPEGGWGGKLASPPWQGCQDSVARFLPGISTRLTPVHTRGGGGRNCQCGRACRLSRGRYRSSSDLTSRQCRLCVPLSKRRMVPVRFRLARQWIREG
jgi:hypothetical protein